MSSIRHVGSYIGGPLDGGVALAVRGQWSIYRTNYGHPLKAAEGDREFLGRGSQGKEARTYYVHADEVDSYTLDDGTHVIQHHYIHATAYKAWRALHQENS